MPPSRPSTGRRVAAVTALLIPILALGAFLLVRASDDSEAKSRAAVETFAAVWSRGDDAGAGALTDSPKAAAALKTNRDGLDGAKVSGHARGAHRQGRPGDGASAGRVAGARDRRLRLHGAGHRDQDQGRPLGRALRPAHDPPAADRDHPPRDEQRAADAGRHPRPRRRAARRAPAGRAGRACSATRSRTSTPAPPRWPPRSTSTQGARRPPLKDAGPKQFVEAQTLRKSDYDTIKADLDGIDGLLAVDDTAPLAPTRAFARALLGGVGPATAEQVKTAGRRAGAADRPVGPAAGLREATGGRRRTHAS